MFSLSFFLYYYYYPAQTICLPAWPLYDFASFMGLSRYCRETIGAGFRRGHVRHRRASGLTNMSLCYRAGWYLHEKSKIRMCKQPGGDAAEIDADLESSQRLLSHLISCVRERAGEINIYTRKYTLCIFPFNLLSYLYPLSSRPPKLSRRCYLSHFLFFLHPFYLPAAISRLSPRFCLFFNLPAKLDFMKCHSAGVPVM